MKKHLVSLVVGDWSYDGHNQTESFTIKSNLTGRQIEKAYAEGAKRLGVDLKKQVACEYEDPKIHKDVLQKFFEEEIPEEFADHDGDTYYLDPQSYAELYLLTVMVGDPKFEYEVASVASIGVGGYGLFSA